MAPARRCLLGVVALSLLGSSAGAAQPIAPYIVTSSPILVGIRNRICIAIAPIDAHGVWWWEPGGSGCATRSTDVFRADEATVSRPRPGLTAVDFRLGIHSVQDNFVQVRLILAGCCLESQAMQSRVEVEGRSDLTIPFEQPRARSPEP